MNKLPKIYHKDERIISNNKYSYISYEKRMNNSIKEEKLDIKEKFNYITLFNKKVEIVLNNQTSIYSSIISKQNNMLLLSNGKKIDINEIREIKKLL